MSLQPYAAAPVPLRVVLDQQSDHAVEGERKASLLKSLLEAGVPVTLNGDDAAAAPLDDSALLVLRDAPSVTDRDAVADAIAGAVEGAAEGTQDEPDNIDVRFRGIDGLDIEQVVALVHDTKQSLKQQPEGNPWKPWFPVIDYDRCTNCMQCLSFCLFGVYDVDGDKQIDVANPQKCKTNCPACSRVCPEVAILFPKYKNGPINGDVVQTEDIQREKMKTDISSLLGGDIYSMLRQRHERANSRFSKERDEDRALKERKRCLIKLKEQFDIPDEVLAELPSADEIQAKLNTRLSARGGNSSDGNPT